MFEWIRQFDWDVLMWINSNCSSDFLNITMHIATYALAVGLWVIAAVIYICRKKTRGCGIMLIAAWLAALIIAQFVLKPLFMRERPYMSLDPTLYYFAPDSGSSFPSAHTAVSFASAVCFFRINRKLVIPAYIAAVVVAFSRLYLFAHFPTDVLAGAAVGTITGTAALLIYKAAENRKKE